MLIQPNNKTTDNSKPTFTIIGLPQTANVARIMINRFKYKHIHIDKIKPNNL